MNARPLATALAPLLLIAPAGALAANRNSSPGSTVGAKPRASTETPVVWQVPLAARRGFGQVTGLAQYQSQPGQREFQIEVEHLRAAAGQSLRVQEGGATVGWMKVSARGIAQLTRNTELGQKTPPIHHGSIVTVRTSAGTLIASAKF